MQRRGCLALLCFLFSFHVLGQYTPKIPTQEVAFSIPYNLVCSEGDQECVDDLAARTEPFSIDFINEDSKGRKERITGKFYFGPSFFLYGKANTQIVLNNGTDARARIPLRTRGSMNFYKRIFTKPEEFYRFIDEPTNMFMLTLEKNNNEFSLSFLHPKHIVTWLWDSREYHNPVVRVTGTHLGKEIDGEVPLAQPLGQNRDFPAFPVILDTKYNAIFSLGYGRRFNIIDSEKGAKLNLFYTPSILGGVSYGNPYVVYAPYDNGEGEGHSWYDGRSDKAHFNGASFGLQNRITLTNKKESIGLSFENSLNYVWKKTNILPSSGPHGHLKMDYGFTTFRVMLTTKLFRTK